MGEANEKCWSLGVISAVMIVVGYPGELIIDEKDLPTRWKYWGFAMLAFLYIVYTLLVGLADATMKESDPTISEKIRLAQIFTVVSIHYGKVLPCASYGCTSESLNSHWDWVLGNLLENKMIHLI